MHRDHPEAPDCQTAHQYLCTLSEDRYREVTQGSEKGIAFQADVNEKDKAIVKDASEAMDANAPSLAALSGKPTLSAKERAARQAAAAERKRLNEEKRANDVPTMVSTWLAGVGKDLRKAPRGDFAGAESFGQLGRCFYVHFRLGVWMASSPYLPRLCLRQQSC